MRRTAFGEEAFDGVGISDTNHGSATDSGDHPLVRYVGGKSESAPLPSDWMRRCFGITRADISNSRRIGITATDTKMSSILRDLNLRNNKTADNDLATLLHDTRVNWSFFDIFADQKEDNGQYIIRFHSQGFQYLRQLLVVVAALSIFVASTHATFSYKMFEDFPLHGRELDTILDITYCILSTIFFFRVSRIISGGVEILEAKQIAWIAMHDWRFYADLISYIPALVPGESELFPSDSQLIRIALVLAKSARIWSLSSAKRIRDDPESDNHVGYVGPLKSFGVMILAIWFIGHVCGCLWFMVICDAQTSGSLQCEVEGILHRGVQQASCSTDSGPWVMYTYCFKTGIYLFLGYDMMGEGALENFLLAFVTPVGALVHAYLFSNMVMIFTRLTALETEHIEKATAIGQAMKTLKLPATLQLRILAFNLYKRIHRSVGTFDHLFGNLSTQLKFELRLVLYYRLMSNVPIFKKASTRMLRELVLVLQDKHFLPGDFIVRAGENGTEMYFINEGKCSVRADNLLDIYRTLHDGEYFGEVALFTGKKRTAYVMAETYCSTVTLAKVNFDYIMRMFPKQLEVIFSLMSDAQRALIRTAASDAAKEREKNPAASRSGSRRPSASPTAPSSSEDRRAAFAFGGSRGSVSRGSVLGLPSSFRQNNDAAKNATARQPRRSFTITLTAPRGLESPETDTTSEKPAFAKPKLGLADIDDDQPEDEVTNLPNQIVPEESSITSRSAAINTSQRRSFKRCGTTGMTDWNARKRFSTLDLPGARGGARSPAVPIPIPEQTPKQETGKTDPFAEAELAKAESDKESVDHERLRSLVRKMRTHLKQLNAATEALGTTNVVLDQFETSMEAGTGGSNDFTVNLEYLHQVVSATAEVLEWQANGTASCNPGDFLQTINVVEVESRRSRPQPKTLIRSSRAANLGNEISASTAVL